MEVIQLRAQGKRLHCGSQKASQSGIAVPTLGSTSEMPLPSVDLTFGNDLGLETTTHLCLFVFGSGYYELLSF